MNAHLMENFTFFSGGTGRCSKWGFQNMDGDGLSMRRGQGEREMGERGLHQRKNCKDSQDDQPCLHRTERTALFLELSTDTEEKL